MADIVGYRFKPTNEEIIRDILEPKIHGNSSLVDNFISEVNICSHDPWELPEYARMAPGDDTWYFYHVLERMSDTNSRVKRMAKTGSWKHTGKDREIKDANGNVIGMKKILTFRPTAASKGCKACWVIHEFHHHLNLPHQSGYVLCKLIYKGVENTGETSLASASGSNNQTEENQEIQAANVSSRHAEFENEAQDQFAETGNMMAYY